MSASSTQTQAPQLPKLGMIGTLRFAWRQLTNMRTALFLLLLLAVGAVPGSILPQRNVDPDKVTLYLAAHKTVGPLLDRVGGFDVFSSVWFSAIYLLLFVSLVGCVLPRSRVHLRGMRAAPPAAPRRFGKLPASREVTVDATVADVTDTARAALRGRRYRVVATDLTGGGRELSAERGRLRETGNLVFHLSLVGLLVAIAAGHLLGWRGDVIAAVGSTYTNDVGNFATSDIGPWVDAERLAPFSVKIDSMDVQFETQDKANIGAPRDFRADVTSTSEPGGEPADGTISVNHPLVIDGAKVFLLGNGYAPVITVRDAQGEVLYSQATPFLPQDSNYTSVGVATVTAAQPQVVALQGLFLPTVAYDAERKPVSIFPGPTQPALALQVFTGEIGSPPSVYTLDTTTMKPLTNPDGSIVRLTIAPGQTVDMPNGLGTVTFDRVERFAGLSVRYDPGRVWALGFAVASMVGLALSLFVPRRRVFVRARPTGTGDEGGRTVVKVAALARGEDTGLDDELERLVGALGADTRSTSLQEASA